VTSAELAAAFHGWSSAAAFAQGTSEGVGPTPDGHGLVLVEPVGALDYTDPSLGTTAPYEYGRWTSPVHAPGFSATEIVASWNADTPPGTWVEVELRGSDTPWYVMGRWASGDTDIHRTSVPGQEDDHGAVDVDTFRAAPGAAPASYQLRVTLYRAPGLGGGPLVAMVGAVASALADSTEVPRGRRSRVAEFELPVPRYSQEVHRDEYPQYGRGGEAWCSPSSTQMVVEYWDRAPRPEDLAWVDPAVPDPQIAHAARMTYDYAYAGTGNWPFNAAYAATYGLRTQVTRLGSLAELERLIARGIPVITSQAFHAQELDGAGYDTDGHLMVVIGVTAAGDVIANDPAAPTNEAVRRVYDRRQFETVWLRTRRSKPDGSPGRGSGGIAYLIRP
jgi:peptidase C39-like protein